MIDVAIVCEDAGGAAALVPVVRALVARGDRVRFALGAVAARTFASAGIAIDAAVDPETLDGARVLVATTSCWGERLEARAVLAARRAGIPSLGMVDFWSNYLPRLSYPGDSDLAALPDRVLAIDETMRRELLAAGVDAARIEVTGSPAFDAILARGAGWSRPEGKRVLFLSQPMAALYGEDARAPRFLGYTEHTVLAALAPVVAEAGAELAVRPHPREDAAALRAFVATLPCRAALDESGALDAAVARARVVVGMTTMALVEAALLGAPVLSAQLSRRGDDGLPTNRTGLTREVSDPVSLRVNVLAALADGASPPVLGALFPAGATARVVAAVDALAHSRGI